MIEKKIIRDNFLSYKVDKFIRNNLSDVPIDSVKFENTPVGERITIATSTPGLVIGREGTNIRRLTLDLKEKFNFENPQIKISEIKAPYLSASIVAKEIANNLARFGSQRFKLTGFKAIMGVMNAGAMGVEIRITGKVPSSRAKSWRFNKGYIKKTGFISDYHIDKAIEAVTLKTGVIGVKVAIMLPNTPLPDKIEYYEDVKVVEEVVSKEDIEEIKEAIKKENEEKGVVEE